MENESSHENQPDVAMFSEIHLKPLHDRIENQMF
jgi:hypothetical protein